MPDTPLYDFVEHSDAADGAEATYNAGLRRTEIFVAGVLDRDLATPPVSPTDGDAYVVAASGTGDWSGWDDRIAYDQAGAWKSAVPLKGTRIPCRDEDTMIEWTGSAWVAVDGEQTLVDAATVVVDARLGRSWVVTLGGNRTLGTPTNLVKGWTYALRVVQDGTGTRLLTWPALVKWAAGAAPTLSTGVGDIDLLVFLYDGTNLFEVSRTLNVS